MVMLKRIISQKLSFFYSANIHDTNQENNETKSLKDTNLPLPRIFLSCR